MKGFFQKQIKDKGKCSNKTFYKIEVNTQYKQWNIDYRYSDFELLHKYVQSKHKRVVNLKFPGKNIFQKEEKF